MIFHKKYCIWVILDWNLKKQISFSKTKAKILTFRTKIALFRYFWTGIWKEKHCYIWSQHPQIIPEAELYTPQKIKILKFRTNNTYVGKFELELKKNKNCCHIWNQRLQIRLIANFNAKMKILQFGTTMPYLGILG